MRRKRPPSVGRRPALLSLAWLFQRRERSARVRANTEASVAQALGIIDVQNDFCPGGALAVPEDDLGRFQVPVWDLRVHTC